MCLRALIGTGVRRVVIGLKNPLQHSRGHSIKARLFLRYYFGRHLVKALNVLNRGLLIVGGLSVQASFAPL